MMSQRFMLDAESHLRHRRGQRQPLYHSPGQPERQTRTSRLKVADRLFPVESSLVKVLELSPSHNNHRTSRSSNLTSRSSNLTSNNSHRDHSNSNFPCQTRSE
jgi:hypothetical protein